MSYILQASRCTNKLGIMIPTVFVHRGACKEKTTEKIIHVFMGRWFSGILPGLLRRRSVVRLSDPPTLEKCAKGICLCNLLRSTEPNDRETVIEG